MDGPSRVLVKNLVHIYEKKSHKLPEASSTDHGSRIQMKFNEVISSMGRTEDIVSILHRENKISDQEKSDIDQFQSIPLRAKEELLGLVMGKPRDVYETFLGALNDTNQQYVVQILVSEIEIAHKETTAHAGLIVRLYNWLTDNLNTDNSCIVALYRNDVLTKREREQLESENNPVRRNQLLLSIVSKKNDDEFQRFLSGLGETNQVKVINKFKGVDFTDGDTSSLGQDNSHSSPSPAVRPVAQLNTRIVPKPLPIAQRQMTMKPPILSPKPQRPMSPAAPRLPAQRQPAAERQASEAGEPRSPSPTAVLSPTRRSWPNFERQLSNPTSPVFHEVSLKVASLRQSCTDVEDEIKKKKHLESVQLDRDRDIKVKEVPKLTPKSADQNSEWTITVSPPSMPIVSEVVKTGPTTSTTTISTITTAATISKPSQPDKSLDQLRSSLKDNEELRNQLSSANSKQKLMEAEFQKLRNEQEGNQKDSESQLKKLRVQLEEKVVQIKESEQFKGELNQTRVDLRKEIEMNRGQEKLLIESKTKLQELHEQNEDLERCLKRLQNENQNTQVESQEFAKELRSEQEALLGRSKARISELEKQLLEKEKQSKENISIFKNQLEDAKRQDGDKFSNLEKHFENNERMASEKIAELEKKLQHSERNLNQVIEEEHRNQSMKSGNDKSINELQVSLTSAHGKISDLTSQLEEKTAQMNKASDESQELSRLQFQLDKERELNRERESLLVESLEKNADILRQMGLVSERLKDEEKKSRILEMVQVELAEERKLKQKEQKELQELHEAFDRVNAHLHEAKQHLQDKDESNYEIEKLLSELHNEKQRRVSLELTTKEAYHKVSSLQNEIETKDKLLTDKTQENEAIDDLMTQLNEEKLLRIEVDKRLYDVDEEMSSMKQHLAAHQKLLHKANKEKETLSHRLLELNSDSQAKATLETLLTEANEERDFFQNQCGHQQKHLQRADEEKQELIQRLQELKSETELKSYFEERLQETEQEFHRLKKHSDNREILLQQTHVEKQALAEKLVQVDDGNQTRTALVELLEKANEEISLLRKQNDGQKKILEQQNSDSEEFRNVARQFQQEQYQNSELRRNLRDAEGKLSELFSQIQENQNQASDFKEQELEITQLLQDINKEKSLRFEQQEKLDDAKGTIAILSQRLETAESKFRNEYSSTTQPDTSSNEHQLRAVTQQLQELSKAMKEKESELWKAKKELAKERLLKKDVEKSLEAACERERDMRRRQPGTEQGRDSNSTGNTFSMASDSTAGASQNFDFSIGDELRVLNSGPALNLRLIADRPKRKKNHVVKTSAGLLARETSLANGNADDLLQLRPASIRLEGAIDTRTRPNSMANESII